MNGPDGSAPPPRVRVTHPRTDGPARRQGRSGADEIDAQSALGRIYMGSLLRAQLRLAGVVILAIGATAIGLPLLFAALPGLAERTVGGVPASWLVLALAIYPAMVLAGWWYVRAAERTERDFADEVRER